MDFAVKNAHDFTSQKVVFTHEENICLLSSEHLRPIWKGRFTQIINQREDLLPRVVGVLPIIISILCDNQRTADDFNVVIRCVHSCYVTMNEHSPEWTTRIISSMECFGRLPSSESEFRPVWGSLTVASVVVIARLDRDNPDRGLSVAKPGRILRCRLSVHMLLPDVIA